MQVFQGMAEGQGANTAEARRFFIEMAKNVRQEKDRIGGNWVVAQAVPTREMRDCIKDILGPEAIFVTLTLSEETQKERVKARHSVGDEASQKSIVEFLSKLYKLYESAGEEEENAVDVLITPDMSREDVMRNILKVTKNFKRVSSLINFFSKVTT